MTNTTSKSNSDSLIISYLSLRVVVGILGIIIPIVLIMGSNLFFNCSKVNESISAYYHTGMRDVFVGSISAIAVFLFSYKGYDRIDAIVGNLASISAIGVALFPSSYFGIKTSCISKHIDSGIFDFLHEISAAVLFLMLAYFSYFLFTKSSGNPTSRKLKRNLVYRICGVVIVFCILGIIIYVFCLRSAYPDLRVWNPIFCLESIALWAFGISWLTKGEMILADLEANKYTQS